MTSPGQQKNILDMPMYPSSEASRLVGLSAVRVRRWLSGYSYKYEDIRRDQLPVIRRLGTLGTSYASFLDLVDLLFVKRFLEHGISLQKLRKALDEASVILETNHFARQSFFTEGRNIYLQVKDKGDAILQLLSGGQWVIPEIIRQLADQIDFDEPTGFARRWYPQGPNGLVVLDPKVSFGRPHIMNKGVTTLNVYDFFMAESRNFRQVSRWLNLNKKEVEAAVRFEEGLAA